MKTKKIENNITVCLIPLGCPKAIVDAEKMLAQIAEADLLITADKNNADVVVINTCGFIEPAKQEALENIQTALDNKAKGNVKKVIVTGCLAQRLGERLRELAKDIDVIVSLDQRDNIAEIIKKTIREKEFTFSPLDYKQTGCDDTTRLLITPSHWAYLRISEGCDHRCSFCTIPNIRGRFKSRSAELVIEEAKQLADSGVLELNVIAQDTTYYGRDIGIKKGLVDLLGKLNSIDKLKWIRLMYMYPTLINDLLIDTIAESEKIVKYLDIPIQHINDDILVAMKRPDSKKSITELIEKLRAAMPDVVLRTTVIVGFPGESQQQFAELLDFVKWAKFDALGAFKYYPEKDTPAAKMPNQLSDDIKNQRFEQIMLAQQQIAFEKNHQMVGSKLRCLIDQVDSGAGYGRYYGQAPDIDSICIVKDCKRKAGEFVDTKVTAVKDYDLIVEEI